MLKCGLQGPLSPAPSESSDCRTVCSQSTLQPGETLLSADLHTCSPPASDMHLHPLLNTHPPPLGLENSFVIGDSLHYHLPQPRTWISCSSVLPPPPAPCSRVAPPLPTLSARHLPYRLEAHERGYALNFSSAACTTACRQHQCMLDTQRSASSLAFWALLCLMRVHTCLSRCSHSAHCPASPQHALPFGT